MPQPEIISESGPDSSQTFPKHDYYFYENGIIPGPLDLQTTVASIRSFVEHGFQTPVEYTDFLDIVREEATSFRTTFEENPANILNKNPFVEKALNKWITSPDGNNTMLNLADTMGELVISLSPHGSVSHETRHVAMKDAFACLEHLVEEGDSIQPYQLVSFLGSLMHDFGRFSEIKAYEKAGTAIGDKVRNEHGAVSFYFTKQILAYYKDIPPEICDQILYAVLTHQDDSSKIPEELRDQFIPSAVKAADRAQKEGAEGPARLLAYICGEQNGSVQSTPDASRRTSLPRDSKYSNELFYMIEYHLRRNVSTNSLHIKNMMNALKSISGIFLWVASTDEMRNIIFHPELAPNDGSAIAETSKTPLEKSIWERIKQGPQPWEKEAIDAKKSELQKKYSVNGNDVVRFGFAVIEETVCAPGAKFTNKLLENLYEQFKEIAKDKEAGIRFSEGLLYILAMRDVLDARQQEYINDVLSKFPEDTLKGKFARIIHRATEKADSEHKATSTNRVKLFNSISEISE